jgi:hypothetical protein
VLVIRRGMIVVMPSNRSSTITTSVCSKNLVGTVSVILVEKTRSYRLNDHIHRGHEAARCGYLFYVVSFTTTIKHLECVALIEILALERACLSCSCKHFGRKNPCKKSADLRPRQGNLLHWNIFTGLNKTSLHFTK